MTTQEIADRLVALNRENNHELAYKELYSEDILSIENWDGERTEHKGMDAIKKKGEGWYASVAEIHETTCSEPLVADNSFAVTFFMDITYKDAGRQSMTELAVYTVKDGKIVEEEFKG